MRREGGGGGVGVDSGAAGVVVLAVAQGEVGGEEEAERATGGDGKGVADRGGAVAGVPSPGWRAAVSSMRWSAVW